MRWSGRAALLIAAALLPITGCTGSPSPGPSIGTRSPNSALVSASPATTAPPSSPVASSASSIRTAPASSAPRSTGPASTSSTTIAELDKTSATWYGAVCDARSALTASASGVQGADLASEKKNAAAAYNDLSNTAKATVGKLSGLAAPLLPVVSVGRSIKAHRIAEFQAFADGYRAAAVTVGAAQVTTQAQLQAVVTSVESQVKDAVTKAGAGAPVIPADVQAAIDRLPECGGR